jgi:hypothetical protein
VNMAGTSTSAATSGAIVASSVVLAGTSSLVATVFVARYKPTISTWAGQKYVDKPVSTWAGQKYVDKPVSTWAGRKWEVE